ncbi:MAG TPA: PaaI family thioesterase [Polyangiaceae bacterium]|nr:PaaI family thioesterase [Polyangiaceae bacterium]
MNLLADLVRMSRENRDFTALVDAIPYLKFLGIGMESVNGELVGKMTYADALIGNASLPALHGGTIGALLESTAIFQALVESETLVLPKIVTITVDFLRSGRPVDTFARGTITKQGKRVVNVSVEAWQEDRTRPIARANAIFIVEPFDEG